MKKGATFITNSTSHAAFKGSKQLERQIRAVNTVRAIETGRYIAVATNFNNNNYVIRYDGTTAAELVFKNSTNHLAATIIPQQYRTPYTRFGDVVVALFCLSTYHGCATI